MFRKAADRDILQLKQMWQSGFGDTQQDIDLFFQKLYPSADTFVCADGDNVQAVAYCLRCSASINGENRDARYLYALTSRAEVRNKGIMTALIDFVKSQLEVLLWLTPADERLRQFYAKRGFSSFFSLSEREFTKGSEVCQKAEKISARHAAELRQKLLSGTDAVTLSASSLDYAAEFYGSVWLKIGENALALARPDKGQVTATEFLAENQQAAADAVCAFFGADTLCASVPYSAALGEKLRPMIWLPNGTAPNVIYSNFELN